MKKFLGFFVFLLTLFLLFSNSFAINNVFSTKSIQALEDLLNQDGVSAFSTDSSGNASISGELTVNTIKQTSDTLKQCLFHYSVDPNATDQGVDTTASFKNIIDSIGTTDVLIVFTGGDPNNIYTFSTSEVSGSNVYLKIEPGAFLDIDSAKSLTVYSPDHIVASPRQKIKIGSGALNFTAEGTIYPGWYGTPINGTDDSTSYFTEIDTAMVAGSTVKLLPGADYFVDTSGGITFSKKIYIDGFDAKFTTGVNVGNNPTITSSANGSKFYGFEIDGSANFLDVDGDMDFADAGDSPDFNLRKGLYITGDDTECIALIDTNSVFGIHFDACDNGFAFKCKATNSIVSAGTPADSHNYCAGLMFSGTNNATAFKNNISGYGQGILQNEDGAVANNSYLCNTISNSSNNGIYCSSGSSTMILFNDISGHDSTGVKARGSYQHIHFNLISCTQSVCVGGIAASGNGTPDGDGWNGFGVSIESNIISGDAANGITITIQDAGYLKDPIIKNNIINWDESPSQDCYSIRLVSVPSNGAIISGNSGVNHSTGIMLTVTDPNNDFNDHVQIINNIFNGSSQDAYILQCCRYGQIGENQGKNGAAAKSGIALYTCTKNKFYNNDFSDTQDTPTMRYGIEAANGSDYNYFFHNDVSNVVLGGYTGLGANSTVH